MNNIKTYKAPFKRKPRKQKKQLKKLIKIWLAQQIKINYLINKFNKLNK